MKWTRMLALWTAMAVGTLGLSACEGDPTDIGAPPPAPTVTATVDGDALTVSWTAVAGAMSYRVEVKTTGEADRTQNTGETEVRFTELTEGATYSVQVFAINAEGETGSSSQLVPIDDTVVLVTSDVTQDTTWTADKTWVLTQPIFVGVDCGRDGAAEECVPATLTIEPGTTILGRTDVPQGVRGAYLVVSRGSRLVADATGEDRKPTADEVIVFTSDRPAGQRARGDWGGLVINGAAPTNAGDEAQGEGDSGFYGGSNENDDSGILRGVRIEFAGDNVTPADQLNGLALQGVGAGTTISYVQIHYNTDDGIEPFGGTVSVDHLVVTGIGDDSVDGTDGYRGFMQFIVGQQRADNADQGFEISNDGDDGTRTPHSTAVIANATMIGAAVSGEIAAPALGSESDDGVQLREGSHYRLYNSILAGFGTGFCINDASTVVNAQNRAAGQTDPATTLSAEGLILFNNGTTFCDDADQAFFETDGFNNMVADPGLDASAFDIGSLTDPPNLIPAGMPAGYTAVDVGALPFDTHLVAPTDGRTLVQTRYAGAVDPAVGSVAEAWYAGWTVWSTDGSDSRPNADGN